MAIYNVVNNVTAVQTIAAVQPANPGYRAREAAEGRTLRRKNMAALEAG